MYRDGELVVVLSAGLWIYIAPLCKQEFSFCSKNELTYTFYVGLSKPGPKTLLSQIVESPSNPEELTRVCTCGKRGILAMCLG